MSSAEETRGALGVRKPLARTAKDRQRARAAARAARKPAGCKKCAERAAARRAAQSSVVRATRR